MTLRLKIAVASGKGGTGKTTIATNLAACLAKTLGKVAYVDCDVEEPNGHVFLDPELTRCAEVTILVPEVDQSRCTSCGACGRACKYSAIISLPSQVLTFPKLCHGCGGCSLACPENAILEVPRALGIVEEGHAGKLSFLHGKLEVGEAMSPPVIRGVVEAALETDIQVLDAPPGTSCPVVETVKDADVVLLVTEPTPFGLNDLMLAVEMISELGLPFGVAINRDGIGNETVSEYCAKKGIPVLLRIPNDISIARAYSRGEMIIESFPELEPRLTALYERLREQSVSRPTARKRVVRRQESIEISKKHSFGASPHELVRIGAGGPARELVVISGKGGTGKTSIVASFSALAGASAVLADCDVDAADLHLVLEPKVLQTTPFSGGDVAVIDRASCNGCGLCAEHCRFDAVHMNGEGLFEVDPISCEGCGVCANFCPEKAASMVPSLNGHWFISEGRHGPMVHARLGIAEENSGKLVSLVRKEAKALAESHGRNLIICDGSPGTGCPVIASITGAHRALVVTETTLSGLHDLKRVAQLCRQLGVKAGVCINKADINTEIAARIEAEAAEWSIPVWGRVHYDEIVTAAQVAGRSVVEHCDGAAARDVRALWSIVEKEMQGEKK